MPDTLAGQDCYPGTDVLVNLLDERDPERLSRIERIFTAARIADLLKKPVRGNFDLEHLKRIHRCIFQDVYPWAGEIRTVDISKGFRFCHAAYIEKEARRLFSRLHERIEKGVRDTGEAVELAAHALSEINAIHPFRDGNGRAQREFVREMLLKLGFTVEYSRADPSLMLKASIASFMGDEGPMRGLFRACTFKNTGSNRK
ncbi:MAG: Fic family protein [Aeromonadales bacterium]|nr:Fic family protein [Aeromonadales bacterium]MDY2891248.1 Fic family protein [Succinivibrio sp.]